MRFQHPAKTLPPTRNQNARTVLVDDGERQLVWERGGTVQSSLGPYYRKSALFFTSVADGETTIHEGGRLTWKLLTEHVELISEFFNVDLRGDLTLEHTVFL